MNVKTLDDVAIEGKRVVIREDFNVPINPQGKITSDARLLAALPTINAVLDRDASVILLSHLGRPKAGEQDAAYTLRPVAHRLTELLGRQVRYEQDWQDGVAINSGDVVLCENVRFHHGETSNDLELAQRMANLGDVFVNDAFATAHRAHASTVGIAKHAKAACAGPLLLKELSAVSSVLNNPKQPLVAIVGGAKVSTKCQVLKSLITRVNTLIVGGGMANTFLAAKGYPMGESMYEADFIPMAKEILLDAETLGVNIPLPIDVQIAHEFSSTAAATTVSVNDLNNEGMILDIGPETATMYANLIQQAGTIIWNGPVGVFEFESFAKGTEAIALAVAKSPAFSIAGGGDTLAALDKFNINDQVSYVSTGGGAFLELLEGKVLPGVAVLMDE